MYIVSILITADGPECDLMTAEGCFELDSHIPYVQWYDAYKKQIELSERGIKSIITSDSFAVGLSAKFITEKNPT